MGERKGVNKWYPPDYDPTKGGLNKWQGTHALRERAKKIHLGILIIRFEMPYNIWCEGIKFVNEWVATRPKRFLLLQISPIDKVSLLGVDSLWGDCTFIPADS